MTSDGETYSAPGLSPGQAARRRRLQKALARKRRLNPCSHDIWVTVGARPRLKRGYCPPPSAPAADCRCWKHSARYRQDKLAYLRLAQREARQRAAGAHLASRALADKYATVVMEDLNVSGMASSAKGTAEAPGRNVRQKAGLNRSILAANWYQLEQLTAYKTALVKVPAAYTSQTCPGCGHVAAQNRVSRDEFRCVKCGLAGHADIVGAINIRDRYQVPAAAAQTADARESIPLELEPVNSRPDNSVPPSSDADREYSGSDSDAGERSRAGQGPDMVLSPVGPLVPPAWGFGTARTRARIRRSRLPGNRSGRNGG